MAKNSILWINKPDHLEKIPAWIALREERITDVVTLHHDDTGAVSICFFDGDFEEGIIRCASEELAEAAFDVMPPQLAPVSNLGGKN